MNIDQTARLLALVQVIDNRRVDEATILAWHPLVSDLDFLEASEAVNLHRQESREYLLPAHVRENVRRIQRATPFDEDELGNPSTDDGALGAQRRVKAARGRQRAVTS